MKETKKKKRRKEQSWEGVEEFFATEVIKQSKAKAKRWFITWIVTLITWIVTLIALIVTNKH